MRMNSLKLIKTEERYIKIVCVTIKNHLAMPTNKFFFFLDSVESYERIRGSQYRRSLSQKKFL